MSAALDSTRAAWLPAGGLGRVLLRLASLKFTAVLLLVLTAGVVAAYRGSADPTWVVAIPLALFALNLGAALLVHPAFHRQPALLIFHLALMAGVLLLAVGRLTYLKGHVEVTEGMAFAAKDVVAEAGPWHSWDLDRVHFVNEGFRIRYAPGVQRGPTRNVVSWRDEEGAWRRGEIGDTKGLVIHGYRFYTSPNKGFAPTFAWRPNGGEVHFGSIHLPSYPRFELRQVLTWTPPGAKTPLRTKLRFDETILDPEGPTEFRLPAKYNLLVGEGDARRELRPGEALRLPEGELTYLGLRAWMGYALYYDPTLAWLLACGLVAVASLGKFLWDKFAARPWNPVE